MKKLSLLLALLLLLSAFPMPAAAARAEVVIMIYLCGADLETDGGQASADIKEMIRAGVADGGPVEVIVATGGSKKWHYDGVSSTSNQFHRVTSDGLETLESIGDRNMGEADTLAEFLEYGFSNFPAERYMLIMWDHGGGPLYGLCYDEKHGDDQLTMEEVEIALADGIPEGDKLDLICFDACLMNSVEVFASVAPYADYVVASQEVVTGTGMDYDKWLEMVVAYPEASTVEYGVSLADTYIADNTKGKTIATVTMSVVDMARIPAVVEAAEQFGMALSEKLGTQFTDISRARQGIMSFGEYYDDDASDLLDIGEVCDAFSPILPEECDALRTAAEEAVVYSIATGDIEDMASGLSIYMPYSTAVYMRQIREAYYALEEMPAYGSFVMTMAQAINDGSYSFSSAQPVPLYSYTETAGATGVLAGIWGQLQEDAGSLSGASIASIGGALFAGRDDTLSGIWSGLGTGSATHDMTGIWAGLESPQDNAGPGAVESIIAGIWSGIVQTGEQYYSSGDEDNDNLTPGITEGESMIEVLAEAEAYFATTGQTVERVFSMQLTKDELSHLSTASGVLLEKQDDDTAILLGSTGVTAVDWETGMIYSLFDSSWATINGTVVPMNVIVQKNGVMRAVIPVRVDREKMYMIVVFFPGNSTGKVLGLTQGYDSETGAATRGFLPLEDGMGISPLYDRIDLETGEVVEQILGRIIFVKEDAFEVTMTELSGAEYLFSMQLTDIYGDKHLTEFSPIDVE